MPIALTGRSARPRPSSGPASPNSSQSARSSPSPPSASASVSRSGASSRASEDTRRERAEVRPLLAREERLRQDDELSLDALERGPEDAVRDLFWRQAGAVRERERRGEGDEARPRERRDVTVAERLTEARPALRFRRAVGGVRVEDERQRPGSDGVR